MKKVFLLLIISISLPIFAWYKAYIGLSRTEGRYQRYLSLSLIERIAALSSDDKSLKLNDFLRAFLRRNAFGPSFFPQLADCLFCVSECLPHQILRKTIENDASIQIVDFYHQGFWIGIYKDSEVVCLGKDSLSDAKRFKKLEAEIKHLNKNITIDKFIEGVESIEVDPFDEVYLVLSEKNKRLIRKFKSSLRRVNRKKLEVIEE